VSGLEAGSATDGSAFPASLFKTALSPSGTLRQANYSRIGNSTALMHGAHTVHKNPCTSHMPPGALRKHCGTPSRQTENRTGLAGFPKFG
jgi:hypothetical protein